MADAQSSAGVTPPPVQKQTMYTPVVPGVKRKPREVHVNPWLLLFLFIAAAWTGGYSYLKAHPDAIPPAQMEQLLALKDQAQKVAEDVKWRAEEAKERLIGAEESGTTQQNGKGKQAKRTPRPKPAAPLKNQYRVYLTNGDWVTGELVRESADEVVLSWDYGEVSFTRKEVLKVVKEDAAIPSSELVNSGTTQTRTTSEVPAHNPVTLRLTNGGVVTGELLHEMPEQVVLRFEYGEVVFPRREIQRMEKVSTNEPASH